MEPAARDAPSVFKALADPTRVRILRLLEGGPLCVGDLVQVLGVSQPKASRHLAYLRRTGLVEDEKRGLWCFYRLTPARAAWHRRLLALLDAFDSAADKAALRKLRTAGGCCPQHGRKS
ncbi:MAG: ArsR/SmtB family transcription factor [Myxococcales bacterium]